MILHKHSIFLILKLENIYTSLGLTPKNVILSYGSLHKILHMNKQYTNDEILEFYLQHRNNTEKMICNGEETISLRDIMLESDYFVAIINYCNTYRHKSVIDYYIRSFDQFKIKNFICSDTYQEIILGKVIMTERFAVLLVLIANAYYDYICIENIIEMLPPVHLNDVNLNKYTFMLLINKSGSEIIPKLFNYRIESHEEIECLIHKLKYYDFYKAVVKHLRSQQIINNTMLITALLIKDDLEDLDVRNVDFSWVLQIFKEKRYLYFNNESYKKALFKNMICDTFDIELFTYSISEHTFISYDTIKDFKHEDFTAREIYLIYFYKKFNTTLDRNNLKNDVKEMIVNKIYDTEVLKFILINDLDFNLLEANEIETLCNVQEVEKILCLKYTKLILQNKIEIESNIINGLEEVIKNIENTDLKLPIISDISYLDSIQIIKLLHDYIKHYNINSFIHCLIDTNVKDDSILVYLEQNFKMIKSPLDRILIIDQYEITNINADYYIKDCLKRLKATEKIYFMSRIKNIGTFAPYFYADLTSNLCVSQNAFEIYYNYIQNHLQIIEMIKSTRVNESFMTYFLTSLFLSDIDVSMILKSITQFFALIDYNKKILNQCCSYYIKILSNDEFIQCHDLTSARDFLNMMYFHMKKHGKDRNLQMHCERIVMCLRSLSIFFECEIILKNIKNIVT